MIFPTSPLQFPNVDDSDLQPMVFTQREGDVASDPVSITQYIRMLEEQEEAEAAAAEAAGGSEEAEAAAVEPGASSGGEAADATAEAATGAEQQ